MGHRDRGDRGRRDRPRSDRRGAQGPAARPASRFDTDEFDLGGARYLRDGEILSDETLDELRRFDAILLGAVGTPEVPPGVIERGLLLKMRFELDLYVNQRPFNGARHHDFVVIRENTEGPYVGEGGVLRKGTPHEVATQGSVNTRIGVERCVRYAFELASTPAAPPRHAGPQDQRAAPSPATSGSARSTRWPPSSPTIGTAYHHVDAATIYFVQDPQRYDVIVTDNLFGDILTDLGGAVSGGVGLASLGQPQPGADRPEPVRAGARLGAGHRRHGHRQPDGGDPVGGADARLPRRGHGRRPDPGRVRRAG